MDVAIGIISDEKGNHFDPVVVEAFFDARDKILRSYGKAEEQLAQQPLGD